MTPTITWPTGKVDKDKVDKVDKVDKDNMDKEDNVDNVVNVDKVDKVESPLQPKNMLYFWKAEGSRISNITFWAVNCSTFSWSNRPGETKTNHFSFYILLADLSRIAF